MRKAGVAAAAFGLVLAAPVAVAFGLGRAPVLTGAALVLAVAGACILLAIRETDGPPARRALVGTAKGLALAAMTVAGIAGSAVLLHQLGRGGVGPGLPYRPLEKPPLTSGSTS